MEERCTTRQLGVAVFTALLAPASALPPVLARGGALGWLALGVVFPLALLVAWRLDKLGHDGLAARLKKGPLGKLILTLYYLWAVALCALTAGSCVDRLGRTDYGGAPGWAMALALGAVSAYLIYKGRGAFLRAAEIFYLALVVVLALFFVLGAMDLKGENLRPAAGWGEWKGFAQGVMGAGAALSVGTLAAFFPRSPRRAGESPLWRWLAGWCAVAAGLCVLVIGALGARLTTQAPLPFFLTLQGIGFPGGFQRLEALGTAAWVLSDLTLLGLAALAARRMAGDRAWAAAPPLVAAVAGGCLLSNAAVEGVAAVLYGVNLALGAALPVVLSLLPAPGGGQGRGISCG